MLSYWTNFSKTGNPNDSDLPDWETMKAGEEYWHELGEFVGKKSIERLSIYHLLDKII